VPTVFTHAIAGAAIGLVLEPRSHRRAVTAIAAAAAVLPDADFLGLCLGIDYGDLLGHRGFTHSLLFAGIAGAGAAAAARWARMTGGELWHVAACAFAAMACHGVLDALTNGGLGVAFFAPFDDTRYFFPVTPIEVAPLRASALFTRHGGAVIASEARWVWIPAAAMAGAAALARTRGDRRPVLGQ
jgi:inner membrane protein